MRIFVCGALVTACCVVFAQNFLNLEKRHVFERSACALQQLDIPFRCNLCMYRCFRRANCCCVLVTSRLPSLYVRGAITAMMLAPLAVILLVVAGIAGAEEVPIVNISALPMCPFSRWYGEPRYCYECRWCPFRAATCCEMEDEVDMLKSVNVSGTDNWDCFITIVHFQQCGRCSPSARSYVQQVALDAYHLNYVWDSMNLTIRPCKQACTYIYNRCRSATLLNGQPVIPPSIDASTFCAPFPAFSTPDLPCYNSAGALSLAVAVAALAVLVAVLL